MRDIRAAKVRKIRIHDGQYVYSGIGVIVAGELPVVVDLVNIAVMHHS